MTQEKVTREEWLNAWRVFQQWLGPTFEDVCSRDSIINVWPFDCSGKTVKKWWPCPPSDTTGANTPVDFDAENSLCREATFFGDAFYTDIGGNKHDLNRASSFGDQKEWLRLTTGGGIKEEKKEGEKRGEPAIEGWQLKRFNDDPLFVPLVPSLTGIVAAASELDGKEGSPEYAYLKAQRAAVLKTGSGTFGLFEVIAPQELSQEDIYAAMDKIAKQDPLEAPFTDVVKAIWNALQAKTIDLQNNDTATQLKCKGQLKEAITLLDKVNPSSLRGGSGSWQAKVHAMLWLFTEPDIKEEGARLVATRRCEPEGAKEKVKSPRPPHFVTLINHLAQEMERERCLSEGKSSCGPPLPALPQPPPADTVKPPPKRELPTIKTIKPSETTTLPPKALGPAEETERKREEPKPVKTEQPKPKPVEPKLPVEVKPPVEKQPDDNDWGVTNPYKPSE